VSAIAKEKNATPGQIALAWLLAQGPNVVPIPGAKRRTFLEENADAVKVELTPSDIERIEKAAPRGATAGARYQGRMMNMVNR